MRSKTIVFIFEANAADASQQGAIASFISAFPSKYPGIGLAFRYVR
jgi:hypothetical protein